MITTVERHFLGRGRGVEFEMEAAWIHRHLRSTTGPVLDVGCGIGALFPTIGESGVIGLDHALSGLSRTRSRYPLVPLICASADCLPFKDQSLAAITSQHVIEHLAHDLQACREWYRTLRPGGNLLLLTPCASFCDPGVYDDETHVQIYDHIRLRRLLVQAGFQMVEMRSLGLPWFRNYQSFRGGWRLRRLVTHHAALFSRLPPWRWKGQTLCCVARRPIG